MTINGLILAGGRGTRMGGADKALLTLGGQPLVLLAIARLRPQVSDIAISANGDAGRFGDLACAVLPDEDPMGPLSGILAGLDWAAMQGAEAIVSVAVDTPFFPEDLVQRLIQASGPAPYRPAVATSGGRVHPTFGLWPTALRDPLRDALQRGEARMLGFAEIVSAVKVAFASGPPDPFRNLNTPQDLARAEAALTG
jgi:molybdopterin-guanine dinucleotide biosynthesis protein A